MNIAKLDALYKIETCFHQTSVMNSFPKGRHKCGGKEEINTLSSTEKELLGLGHVSPELVDIKDAYVFTDLKPNEGRMKSSMILIGLFKKPKDPEDCKKSSTPNRKAKECKGVNKLLIDKNANELKHVNFYKFHNPPIKEENIMKHKEARDSGDTVKQINHEINRIMMYQHSNLKVLVREDKIVMFYINNPEHGGGPKWKDVRITQTFDAHTKYMIEYTVVHPWEDHCMRSLPMRVTHINTIFRYEDSKGKKKENKKRPNRISPNKKTKETIKGGENMRKIVEEDYDDIHIPMVDLKALGNV